MCHEGTACVYVWTQGLGVMSKAANSPSCDVRPQLQEPSPGLGRNSSALSWAVEGGL